MTAGTTVFSPRPAVQRRGHLMRLWTVLLAVCRRRHRKAEGRRQLLWINDRLLRDVGLEGDELLCDARRRFRGEQPGVHLHYSTLFGAGPLNNPYKEQTNAGH